MGISTINPATGEVIEIFSPLTTSQIEEKLTLAHTSFIAYRQTSLQQRSQWLANTATILERDREKFATLMTLAMGKTYKSAIAEVEKCAWVCRYYSENGSGFLADKSIITEAKNSFVRYQPLGVILAVMPWNFPFWQVFRFAAPALMAGNVALLKHASNVPGCALAIETIFREAGFPQGVFQTLLIGADAVASIMADDRIKAATLTGSESAGASLAAIAGKKIKKIVLELGGSDPFIILESADVEKAVNSAVTSRMLNNGQSCIAAKRFIVQESIAPRVEKLLVEKFQQLKVGNPMAEDTDIGPLATPNIMMELEAQVEKSIAMGAKVLCGGKALKDIPGNYYLPTILTDISPDSPTYTEEFFGPVALLFRVANLEDAIALANATPFGLGASSWTNEPLQWEKLIDEIEAGSVFINSLVKSDPRLPFGGTKKSGYGRELGIEGMQEFLNVKTVWIAN